ncbi:DUF4105 domain-containing protein [Starkeya sp. 3C]|uniref:DUF4105 domain-containing protein n=1 Tax=Ancylobacter moscoviensis TaxID=2597768 RepID=A0ABY3DLR9_9HYPH|nr:DUF4105 domain-containing protein [Ancylobacter moscoviensis]TSJ60198.1 DUF4105 domain-containing protein [Ancylobacter moscoviensis]
MSANTTRSEGRPPHATGTAGRRGTAGIVLLLAGTALLLLWVCAAAWFQFEPPLRWAVIALAVAIGGTIALLAWRRRAAGWMALAAAMCATAAWWASVTPSNDRDWAPDVAHGVTGEVRGSDVELHNVRAFDWRTEHDGTPHWESRRYDLDALETVDLFSSVWGNPAIAHTLIGFGFKDGARVVFSAEIRRERGEEFSEIGGFFKEFELVMIAADPDDIIHLRTDMRRETVSRFPLRLTPEQARTLFLSYVTKANELATEPEFYQTITTNCTTVIFHLARLVDSRMPTDWRILLSGYLPDYLYDLGIIRTDLPLDEVKRAAVLVPDGRPPPASKPMPVPQADQL